MKRWWPIILGITLVGAVIVVGIWAAASFKNHNDKALVRTAAPEVKESEESAKTACEIFTLADAKELLGDTAKGGEATNSSSSRDMLVSACTYKQDDGSNAPVSSNKTASLKVNSPKSSGGISSNKNQFGSLKPADAVNVDGYGDDAYWDSQHGQLNILAHSNWYILSNGPTAPNDRTVDEAKQLADILIGKL